MFADLAAVHVVQDAADDADLAAVHVLQDAADESNMPKAWKMDAGEEPVNFQEPRL